ncbi:LpqN/LpqT family lipoprotein [Mycobacterium sp. ITM-2016-00318]|uniref:LpqN/LpqT family lipoprotein n=1 Tax=Mycobacterium sp. ITM-2016-00318 TaxID=2099693 RepID=UPI001E34EFAE|nr:LpqN/LpqT family lipoprotein [Mycobacterium sp. ITM-2016-00318]WNG91966.1 LpqN/LpqT family lipoprotein [Mycobacterium sp. ITM-2016-00318]
MAQISTDTGDPMRKLRAGGIAILAVVLGLGLASCSSDEKKDDAGGSAQASSSKAPSTTKAPYSPTIPEYIKQNGITEAPVKKGDPGSPDVILPFPPGWEDIGPGTPAWAWGGIKFTGDPAVAQNPPTIIALLSKLTGNVDPAKILEFAPGEMKNLPGYEGDGVGSATKLSGFDAWQIGGTYIKNGVKHAVAQKTVVIPARDGVFVLQLNADGTEDQMGVLADATNIIDEQTKITPAP